MYNIGGDIFIHAKSNSKGNLFQLANVVLKNLPEGSVDKVEEIYGFVYRGGRDLSGFIDGKYLYLKYTFVHVPNWMDLQR